MFLRTIVGLGLVGLLVGIIYFGGLFQCICFSFAAVTMVYEVKRVLMHKSLSPFMLPAYVFAISSSIIEYYLGYFWLMVLYVACVIAMISERIFNKTRTTQDALAGLLLFIYPLSFYGFMVLLGSFDSIAQVKLAVLMTFICPLMGDTFAYFIGTLFGKHKLCPYISPKKTVEGSIAGLFGGLFGGYAVFLINRIIGADITLAVVLTIGFLCGGLGQIGDLFASCIKRWVNIKDFSLIFPGHGGMLDRLDSVLFCAPVVYLCLYAANNGVLK